MDGFWKGVFGNDRPVQIEIGSGTGTFLLHAAGRTDGPNFVGIEAATSRAVALEQAVTELGLKDTIVLRADAACVVGNLVPEGSVDAYHVYFPDPWWKRKHHRRRLFTPQFVAALARTLRPGGLLYVATDVPLVIELILRVLAKEPSFVHVPGIRSPRAGLTRFEEKGLRRGATIHDAAFRRQPMAVRDDHQRSAAPITPAESPS